MSPRLLRTIAGIGLLVLCAQAPAGSFARYHPDQHYRELGFDCWKQQRLGEAAEFFRRAAHYGDKTSQLALALMYWRGDGVTGDRPQAYAWSDLAAERGYPDFLLLRESLWEQLSAEERRRAIEVGAPIYADYGDTVAKPRLNRLLREGLMQKTGSRAGAKTSAVAVAQVDAAGLAALRTGLATATHGLTTLQVIDQVMHALASSHGLPASEGDYYADDNWRPERYWLVQDMAWGAVGEVHVGTLRKSGERAEGGQSH